MAQETFDWSSYYSDEQSGTTRTFHSATSGRVDVNVSQPDPGGDYRTDRDGFESSATMGGDSSGYFEMGVNFGSRSQNVTTTIDFSDNSVSGADSVTDLSFTLYDIDGTSSGTFQDKVTVLAFDAEGNALTVSLTPVDASVVSVSGGVATAVPGAGDSSSGSVDAGDTAGNVGVSISGEVASVRITYGNGSAAKSNPSNQAIGFGDLTFDLTPAIVCFAAGTRILTLTGERPVETLTPGDLIWTLDHGFQALRWIGRRTVPGRGALAPVRFAPGALGNEEPLLVSHQHRVLVQGWKSELMTGFPQVLVPAEHLIDGHKVTRVERDEIVYLHLLFDRHEIISAEGALCESLFEGERAARAVVHARGEGTPPRFAPGQTAARPLTRSFETWLLADMADS